VLLTARPLVTLAAAGGPASRLLATGQAGPSPLWYATRAAGVVALVLLTITVALGVAGVSRLSSPRWPRVITAGLHKNISLLVVAFVVAHVLTTVLDSFVSISPAAAVVPFISSYRPFWLSLGTIAFDLILALVVTSLLRTRISYRAWRAVHWLAYASWPIALWHGLGTGTDARLPWLLALDALCVLLVAGGLMWRLTHLTPGPGRTAAMAVTVAVPVATIVFALIGPLPGQVATLSGPRLATAPPGPAAGTVQAQLTLIINGSQASGRVLVWPPEAR
jgi:sulfoxide reductase heme-binding subunit YedZ